MSGNWAVMAALQHASMLHVCLWCDQNLTIDDQHQRCHSTGVG